MQTVVHNTFREHFGYTPLTERINDIEREFYELRRHKDMKNLQEETGDLISSLLALCSENEWDAEELIFKTLRKIERRADQYKTLGRKTKVAILGGAFNPIHRGHIQLAQFVLNTSAEFDEVWLLPAYNHMANKEMESAEHRLAMCRIAAAHDARIKVFDYEIQHQLRGETYYFLKKLNEETALTEKYQFAMIIGQDNANSFSTWVNNTDLERMAQFVIVPRRGVERDMNVNWYLHKPHIFLSGETDIMEISSSEIRALMHLDSTESDLKLLEVLDKNVYEYILTHNLYGS